MTPGQRSIHNTPGPLRAFCALIRGKINPVTLCFKMGFVRVSLLITFQGLGHGSKG